MDMSRGRLNVREIVSDVLGHLFDFDRPFWRTLSALLARPAETARAYIAGQRRRFVSPFRMFLIAATLATLMNIAVLGIIGDPLSDTTTTALGPRPREHAIGLEIAGFLAANAHLLNVVLVPVLALAYVPMFRTVSGYNLAEQVAGVFYVYTIMFLAATVLTPWTVFMNGPATLVVGFLIPTACAIVLAQRINKDRLVPGLFKGALAHVLMYASVLALQVVLTVYLPKLIVAWF